MLTDNSIRGLKSYFSDKLSDHYTDREISVFFEWTCESVFDCTKSDILLNDRKFGESEILQFRTIAKRLLNHEPIQYVLGEAYFLDRKFYVTPSVLIPRPETEELVNYLIQKNVSGSVLDIGTGSGIIPISLKLALPGIISSGLDVSENALQVANKNGTLLGAEINFYQKDILLEDLDDMYDLIVSNPPYVLESDKTEMHDNVLEHEPHIALFVPDNDPLKFYKRIVELSKVHLEEGGRIAFEIHEMLGEDVADLLSNDFIEVEIVQDMQGKDRIVSGIKKARSA